MSSIDLSNVNRLYAVLLLKSGPKHGYELIKQIGGITGKEPSSSHIYPFLEEMEENGVAKAEESGNRGKKTYRLTEEGRQLIEDQIDSFGQILHAAIEDQVTECAHCECVIYDGGHEKDGEIYCCEHCAKASA